MFFQSLPTTNVIIRISQSYLCNFNKSLNCITLFLIQGKLEIYRCYNIVKATIIKWYFIANVIIKFNDRKCIFNTLKIIKESTISIRKWFNNIYKIWKYKFKLLTILNLLSIFYLEDLNIQKGQQNMNIFSENLEVNV